MENELPIIRIWLVDALVIVLLLSRTDAGSGLGRVAKTGLSMTQAESLLRLVIRHQGYTTARPGEAIERLRLRDGSDPHPGYLDFSFTYESSRAGATAVLGVYSVSPLTGDVWETNLCRRFSFPRLAMAQQIIQARTGRSFDDERNARVGLGCAIEQ